MDVVVTDTNIFFDLISAGLLDSVFKLPLRFHTTDTVLSEIVVPEQQRQIRSFVDSGDLFVKEFDDEEFAEIINMYSAKRNNVSITDCSVWYYARKNNFRLLTGDGKLRSSATADGVIVSGILFLTDMLVGHGIIPPKEMSEKLKELYSLNKRLPKNIICSRIVEYNKEILNG